MSFCGTCRDETVEAWAHGHTHVIPKFGDGAQRYTARSMRLAEMSELMGDNDVKGLCRFPEWNRLVRLLNLPAESTPAEVREAIRARRERPSSHASSRRRTKQRRWIRFADTPEQTRREVWQMLERVSYNMMYVTGPAFPLSEPRIGDRVVTSTNIVGTKSLRCPVRDVRVEFVDGDAVNIRGGSPQYRERWNLPPKKVAARYRHTADGGTFDYEGGSISVQQLTSKMRLDVVELAERPIAPMATMLVPAAELELVAAMA